MVRQIPEHACDHWASLPLAIGMFVSVSALVALCAKGARQLSLRHDQRDAYNSDTAAKSHLTAPRQLLSNLSSKVISLVQKKKGGNGRETNTGNEVTEGYGRGGLWQKSILMGEKCQPPEFSGVIYYDVQGNRLSEPPPRSPRASPLPPRFAF